jgi:hypothetical protein
MRLSTTFPVVCALALAQHALAQTCDTVTVGTPIYIGGSTALRPFVQTVGPLLAAQAGAAYTLFYYGGGSCAGVNNVVDPVASPLAGTTSLTYYVGNPDAGAPLSKSCTIPPLADGGVRALDVAISDVFEETCSSAARPADIGDFLGPAQSMVFAVPNGSTQTAITAEEAYIAIGFGGTSHAAPPWDLTPGSGTPGSVGAVPGNFYFRANTSGTKLILAAAIGVPVSKWTGQTLGGAQNVFDGLAAVSGAAAENSLGILGLDLLDQSAGGTPNRSKVKELAFAAYGQKYAYYPDSTKTSYDKKNLREGRYAGLGYAHFITPIKVDGSPVQDKVKYIIDLLTGATVVPAPTFDVAKTIAGDAHLVPLCAMKVKRDAEGGDIKAYTPAANCSCYFESLVGASSSACVQCNAGTCASGSTCRNGWCESP